MVSPQQMVATVIIHKQLPGLEEGHGKDGKSNACCQPRKKEFTESFSKQAFIWGNRIVIQETHIQVESQLRSKRDKEVVE